MINNNLAREIKENRINNEIFEKQAYEDLNSIKEILKSQIETNDILIEFNDEVLNKAPLLYQFPYDSYENDRIWEQFVALEIIKEIDKNYNIPTNHNLLEEEKLICSNSKEKYLKAEEFLVNKDEVIDVISKLGLPNLRIHFLIRWCRSEYLCSKINEYLNNNLPFITMVYNDENFYNIEEYKEIQSEKDFIVDTYKYIRFYMLNKGINNCDKVKRLLPKQNN